MDRTTRRRARHHVELPADPDPADLPARASSLARVLIPLVAGCPDALSAERVVSDLAAGWSPAAADRVALAVEDEDPGEPAVAALHALAWTLRSVEAAACLRVREAEGQAVPGWAGDLGRWAPAGATGMLHGAERLAFIAFDGPQEHVLAVGTFGGRRSRLGLLRPGTALQGADPVPLPDAADLLEVALGPSMLLPGDGGPDLRHLARRRLAALAE